jgi:hypothetical protein
LPRFKLANKSIRPRQISYVSDDNVLLNIDSPVPPPWRKLDESYVALKNGYLCFHFMQLDSNRNIILHTKRTFVMTPKNIDVILGLELDRRYDKDLDQDGEVAFYHQ